MAISAFNRFYDPVAADKGGPGKAYTGEAYGPTWKEAGIVGAGLGLPAVGLAGAGLLARNAAREIPTQTFGIPASIRDAPMDILGPGRRGAGGKILPFKQLGTLFSGKNPTGLPSSLLAQAEAGPLALGPANGTIYNNPTLTAKAAASGPRIFEAGPVGSTGEAAMAAQVAGAEAKLGPSMLNRLTGGRLGSAAVAPAGSRLATMGAKAAPAILAAMVAPSLTENADEIDESGLLGDVAPWALQGAAIGAPFGGVPALATGAAGAAYGLFAGDRNPNKELFDQQDEMVYQDLIPAMVSDGYIPEDDKKNIEEAYLAARKIGHLGPEEALQAIMGRAITQMQEDQVVAQESVPTEEEALIAQLSQIDREQQVNAMQAQQYAADAMAPMQQKYTQIFQDLAAVRDQNMGNLPPEMRGVLEATNPLVDAANMAAVQANANPLAILVAQQQQQDQSKLGDQLMQLYLAKMQYAGGGSSAGSLPDLLAQGGLDPASYGMEQGAATGQPTQQQAPSFIEQYLSR